MNAILMLIGCDSRWTANCPDGAEDGPICADFVDTGSDNFCQDDLDALGYPVVIQEDLTDPQSFAIHFQAEPDTYPCGGLVVTTTTGEAWVVGLIQNGSEVDLQVPLEPPDQFQVVSWGYAADSDGLGWAGTATTADQARNSVHHWSRQDLLDDQGVLTVYLIRD